MHSLGHKKKRFSLLFLEEGEDYIKDSLCLRHHPDLYPDKRQEKGRIHICTRSIIFEPVDPETAIVRYSYRDIEKLPEESSKFNSNLQILTFSIVKITQLPETRSPTIYKTIQLKPSQSVSFDISYDGNHDAIEILKHIFNCKSFPNVGLDTISKLLNLNQKLRSKPLTLSKDPEPSDSDPPKDTTFIFNISHIERSENITVQSTLAQRIHPYMQIKGCVVLTDKGLYFQPGYQVSAHPVKKVPYSDINKLYKRRWRHRSLGFEVFTTNNKSIFLTFDSEEIRNSILNSVLVYLTPECETENSVENMMLKWQLHEISNYEYLMYLNSAAYRTFSDFTQYPVFPWVLSNYDSEELDLNDPDNFRDLTKPVGALNPQRLVGFLKRFQEMQEPKYLYGSHYSTPGYVIGYLFRKFPLAMLRLHSGKFDAPDRLFDDLSQDWRSVLENQDDVKELIPEFYGEDPSFLQNTLALDLGTKSSGSKVWDVKLPAWSSDAKDFLHKMRQALESPLVSEGLPHWIDLIFGYKQRGELAVESFNGKSSIVFHPLTYEGSVDLCSISDPLERIAIEVQINEFGQTPKQLFKIPHPPRELVDQIPKTLKRQTSLWSVEAIARKKKANVTEISLHKKKISSVNVLNDKIVTTGFDGCLKILSSDRSLKRSYTVCSLAVSGSCFVDEKQVALASYDNNVYVFNAAIGVIQHKIKAHDDAVSGIEYFKDLALLASGSWDSLVKLWDLRSPACPVHTFDEHEEQVLALCHQDFLLTSCDKTGRVVCRDVREGVVSKFDVGQRVECVGQSKHSKHLIIGTKKFLGLYETSGELVTQLKVEGVSCFISDGVFIVNGQEDGNLEMWEFMNGNSMHRWSSIKNVTALQVDDISGAFYAGNKEGSLYIIP